MPPPVDTQISEIRNNPNMPEAAKKIAVGMLEKQKAKEKEGAPKPGR